MSDKEKYEYYLSGSIKLKKYSIVTLANLFVLFCCYIIVIATWVVGTDSYQAYLYDTYDYLSGTDTISGAEIAAIIFTIILVISAIIVIVFYVLIAIKIYQLNPY